MCRTFASTEDFMYAGIYLPCFVAVRRQVVDEFMAAIGAVKRCENCGAYSPRIQKDGFDKLFQVCRYVDTIIIVMIMWLKIYSGSDYGALFGTWFWIFYLRTEKFMGRKASVYLLENLLT